MGHHRHRSPRHRPTLKDGSEWIQLTYQAEDYTATLWVAGRAFLDVDDDERPWRQVLVAEDEGPDWAGPDRWAEAAPEAVVLTTGHGWFRNDTFTPWERPRNPIGAACQRDSFPGRWVCPACMFE